MLEKVFPTQGISRHSKAFDFSTSIPKKAKASATASTEASLQILLKKVKNAIEVAGIIQKKVDCINEYQHVPQSAELGAAHKYMTKCQLIFGWLLRIQRKVADWRKAAVAELDDIGIEALCKDFIDIVMKSNMLDTSKLLQSTMLDVKFFLVEELPVAKMLLYPHFRTWHWEKMLDIFSLAIETKEHSISYILEHAKGSNTLKELKEVQNSAMRGSFLEETLITIQTRVNSMKCQLESYEGAPDLVIFCNITNSIEVVEGDLLTLQSLELSENHYRKSVKNLQELLNLVRTSLKALDAMQPLMIKCFCFFESADVKIQLNSQNKRFKALERVYLVLVNKVAQFHK